MSRKIFMKRYDSLEEQFEPALRKAAESLTASGYEESGRLAERLLAMKQKR